MNFPYLTGEVGKLGIARIGKRIVSFSNAVVYDTFTGADGTPLTAHTIAPVNVPGTAWSNIISALIINNNMADNNFYRDCAMFCNLGVTAHQLDINVYSSQPSTYPEYYLRFYTRYIDSNNNFQFQVGRFGGSGLQYAYIYVTSGGINVYSSGAAMSYNPNTFYAVRIVSSATSVSLLIDGASVISYTSNLHYGATGCGIGAYDTNETIIHPARFDDFMVTPL